MNVDVLKDIKNLKATKNINTVIVTKNQTNEDIATLIEMGFTYFAENKLQEIIRKKELFPNCTFDFIGRIQSNKVKAIVSNCNLIHSVSSFKIIDKINIEADKLNQVQDILIQINISEESTKDGINENEISSYTTYCNEMENINLVGIMVIGNNNNDITEISNTFKRGKDIFDLYDQFTILSMGMSNDYNIAIKHNANLLRLGSIVFKKDYN